MESEERGRQRERLLYHYSRALEQGDFDVVAMVLQQAEQDPALERMILELNQAYAIDLQLALDEQDAAIVRELVQKHMPSGSAEDVETDLPPLTVGDVVARMQSDATLKKQLEHEPPPAVAQLLQTTKQLPQNLTQRSVSELLAAAGVSVSRSFEKFFRETAIFLSLGREQGRARLAATRRQRQKQRTESSPHTDAQSEDKTP